MAETDEPPEYASPPCARRELDPSWTDVPPPGDVARWRTGERTRLIDARRALDAETRRAAAEAVAARLDALLGDVGGLVISGWWPIRAELDLRVWLGGLAARGATAALPVVTEPGRPLTFRRWTAGTAMVRDIWNIPAPADGPEVRPDVVLAPLVGFDPAGYRLGYGGGYFDRTLAAMTPRPVAIGVGPAAARIPTIHPQPHDIPMREIVTEQEPGRR